MKIDREKFLSAVIAVGMTGAVACGGEPPAAAEPEASTGDEVVPEPMPEPEPEPPPAAPPPQPEPEPVVEEAGPTPE
ncbi:MAG: hypothetical protein OXU20_35990 [Myxococcales bacterium]|nr:hypothetical protein [Myxococcales bacterium]MDD9967583.1 hypothetical protein [Myxococcales bacterium]